MAKFLCSKHEVDIHVKNLEYMYKKDKYIPAFYQIALIKGLANAPAGCVLYFFTEINKLGVDFVQTYFGSPVDFEIEPKVTTRRIKELEDLL